MSSVVRSLCVSVNCVVSELTCTYLSQTLTQGSAPSACLWWCWFVSKPAINRKKQNMKSVYLYVYLLFVLASIQQFDQAPNFNFENL